MDVSGMLRPEQLDFEVPEELAHAIDELIAALERDDQMNLDCYLNEVEGGGPQRVGGRRRVGALVLLRLRLEEG